MRPRLLLTLWIISRFCNQNLNKTSIGTFKCILTSLLLGTRRRGSSFLPKITNCSWFLTLPTCNHNLFSAPKNTTFIDTIQSLLDTNIVAQNVTKNLTSWKPPSTFSRHDYDAFDRLLFWHGLLYIPHGPHSLEVLHVCHAFPMVGHLGMFKTIE